MILLNCWKTVNYTRQYGTHRLFIISLITMLLTFIILYISLSYLFVPTTFYDNHFFLFIFCLILVYPVHKLLHLLPISHLGPKIRKRIERKFIFFPSIQITAHEPISKHLFLLALLLPFVTLTAILVAFCFMLPHYVHYITILLAYQTGISVPDLVRTVNILKAPKHAYIEENEDGFEILVSNQQ